MNDTPDFLIQIDPDLCIGSTVCVGTLPEVFSVGDLGVAYVADAGRTTIEAVLEVAADCPSEAITVVRSTPGSQETA